MDRRVWSTEDLRGVSVAADASHIRNLATLFQKTHNDQIMTRFFAALPNLQGGDLHIDNIRFLILARGTTHYDEYNRALGIWIARNGINATFGVLLDILQREDILWTSAVDEILAFKDWKGVTGVRVPDQVPTGVPDLIMATLEDFVADHNMIATALKMRDADFVKGTPLAVQVVYGTTHYNGEQFDPVHHYQMTSSPRGACLIINNEFKNHQGREREGTNYDEQYVGQLFSAFDYLVKVAPNVKSTNLHSVLDSFKRSITDDMDSCIVVVLTHGGHGCIELEDEVDKNIYTDLIYDFDHKSCPKLKDKPKVFIFQSCQSFATGQGQVTVNGATSEGISDVLVCVPTIPGNVANRDKDTGSPYIYSLTKVFMQHAHDTDLETMIRKQVFDEMKEIPGWKRHYPSTASCGSFKKLFLNPTAPVVGP